jgi:transcriptional regulator with XRE-family HTH domain
VNDVVLGRVLRALRRRRGWRQVDLAERAGTSQSHISAIERGSAAASSLRTIRRVFEALEARAEVVVSWRGADLDRLLDEDHRRLVARVAKRLEAVGWLVELEVTYNEYGERGSIDVLALRAAQRACLVVEVKSAIASSEAIGRKLDEKARLAPRIVDRRSGWRPEAVGQIVVLPETMRLRRLVALEETLRRMFPASLSELRAWLRHPVGAVAAIWFLSDSSPRGVRESRTVRVRVQRASEDGRRAAVRDAEAADRPPVPSKTTGTASW